MNIYKCQELARMIGYNYTTFTAVFPDGEIECRWVDAFEGLVGIDTEDMQIMNVDTLNKMFPNLVCSSVSCCEEG